MKRFYDLRYKSAVSRKVKQKLKKLCFANGHMAALLEYKKCPATIAYGKRGGILGWASAAVAGNIVYVNVFVHRKYRHKGIGKALLATHAQLYKKGKKVVAFRRISRNDEITWKGCDWKLI